MLMAGCIAATVSACKKTNTTPPAISVSNKVKTIVYIDSTSLYRYRIVYNAKSDVDSIIKTSRNDTFPTQIQKFNYYGDSMCQVVFYTHSNSGYTPTMGPSISYNSAGAVIRSLYSGYADYYMYSGAELKTYVGGPLHGSGLGQQDYRWSGGDLVQIQYNLSGAQLRTFSYDASKELYHDFQPLPDDYVWNGKQGHSTKHLCTGYSGPDYDMKFYYEFDAEGRIIKKVDVGGLVHDTTATSTYGY